MCLSLHYRERGERRILLLLYQSVKLFFLCCKYVKMAAPRSLGWSTVIISVCMVGLSSLPVRAAQVSTSSCASRPFDKVCHPHVPSRLESTDVEIQTWPKNVNTGFMERVYSGYVPSSGRLYRGNYAKVDDPSAFSFQMLPNGCAQRHNVSFSATELGCTYATNA